MLNWVLNRSLDSASGVSASRDPGAGDTTQIEGPDTPAPVFAARALRSALFGTPARQVLKKKDDGETVPPLGSSSSSNNNNNSLSPPAGADSQPQSQPQTQTQTPTKQLQLHLQPQGILLTPGTGTSRQKRVSFGRDVVDDNGSRMSLAASTSTSTSASTSPWGGARAGGPRRRTRFMEKLENSKKVQAAAKAQQQKHQAEIVHHHDTGGRVSNPRGPDGERRNEEGRPEEDDGWEEEEEGQGQDEAEEDCDTDPDITTDLNDPRSQSGRYWKSEFQKYRDGAKTEMDHLIKYRQLAKSYAWKKDVEATELAEKLRHEQEKVVQMEKKITASASQIASRRLRAGGGVGASGAGANTDQPTGAGRAEAEEEEADMRDLTQQTVLVVEYKNRVLELEAQLEELVRERAGGGDEDPKSATGAARTTTGKRSETGPVVGPTSAQTQRTLRETQRELRKARAGIEETGRLRDQVQQLRAELEAMTRRAERFEEDNARLAAEAAAAAANKPPPPTAESDASSVQLRAKLRDAEEESRRKDEELHRLRAKMDAIEDETAQRDDAQTAVLLKRTSQIHDLRREIKALQAGRGRQGKRKERSEMTEPAHAPSHHHHPRRAGRRATDDDDDTEDADDVAADLEKRTAERNSSRMLRDKYREAGGAVAYSDAVNLKRHSAPAPATATGMVLSDRANLALSNRPRWQPYIPRSPRNPAYRASVAAVGAGAGAGGKMQAETDTTVDLLRDRFKALGAGAGAGARTVAGGAAAAESDEGGLEEEEDEDEDEEEAEGKEQEQEEEDDDEGEEAVGNLSRASHLSTPRRAAAIARLERKQAERKQAERRVGVGTRAAAVSRARPRVGGGKENMRPS